MPREEADWMDYFITEKDGKFIAWDEIQFNELGVFNTREGAVEALWKRADELDEEYRIP